LATYHKKILAIWGKKNSSKSGTFMAFVVWLCQTDPHAGKRLVIQRPLQSSHTFLRASSTSRQHIIFEIKINTNLPRQAQENDCGLSFWLNMLRLIKKKWPPHNLTFTSLSLVKYIDWSKWLLLVGSDSLQSRFHVSMDIPQ
jgi:hypothetical protein